MQKNTLKVENVDKKWRYSHNGKNGGRQGHRKLPDKVIASKEHAGAKQQKKLEATAGCTAQKQPRKTGRSMTTLGKYDNN